MVDDEVQKKQDLDSLRASGLYRAHAQASHLPHHSGDGYYFGGGSVLTIGSISIDLGEGSETGPLARELARRWNNGVSGK